MGGATSANSDKVVRPPECTRDELLAVRRQLDPADDCVQALREPWLQTCSITRMTKCPDSWDWLGEYYSELQSAHYSSAATNEDGGNEEERFVALSVGCNKGFDALETLRMGTFDGSLSKGD